MIKTGELTILNARDRKTIQTIITSSPDSPFSYLVLKLSKAFKNITPNHYVVLGYMIGYSRGAVETYGDILNNNTPCQRQN